MNERLKQFLTMEGISPARFAEIVGINRSGISHLLAGRNNPSFEFIQKMLSSFPDLNPEWLILGKGKPYKTGEKNGSLPQSEPEIFEEPVETELFTEEIPLPELPENPKNNPVTTDDRAKSAKKIARITVFFTDGSYEDR